MGHAIAPFVQPLFPVFMTSLKDEDDEVRSNTIYGLGLLAFYGGDIMLPYPFNCSEILLGFLLVFHNQEWPVEPFHSHGQPRCKFIGAKQGKQYPHPHDLL